MYGLFLWGRDTKSRDILKWQRRVMWLISAVRDRKLLVPLFLLCTAVSYFRCQTAGYKSVFGRSCDRPPSHRFFLVSLCL
jgi:hypothetical protein